MRTNRIIDQINERKTIDGKISKTLIELGIKPSVKGFNYLKSSIKLAIEDPSSIEYITKILYIKLAKQFHVSPYSFERDIRVAIKKLPETEFRSVVFSSNMDHYTNKDFILHIANFLACP